MLSPRWSVGKNVDASFNFQNFSTPLLMSKASDENTELVKESLLYKEFLAEREEILRHKWIESEKAGHDIGFEKALLDWIVKHRSTWRDQRHQS